MPRKKGRRSRLGFGQADEGKFIPKQTGRSRSKGRTGRKPRNRKNVTLGPVRRPHGMFKPKKKSKKKR